MREKEIDVLYEEIEPALELFEPMRTKALKQTEIMRMVMGISFTVIALCLLIFAVAMPWQIKLVILAPLFGIMMSFRNHFKKGYITKYKKDLTQMLFARKGIKIIHEPNEYIYSSYFKKSDLFDRANTFSGDDFIKGEKDGLYFLGSELRARYTKKRKNRSNIDRLIFDGFYFCGQIPVDTGTTITIHTTDFKYPSRRSKGEIPDFEFNSLNAEFDHNFKLEYSDYDLTSHILSPEFMQHLLDFKRKHQYPFVIRIARNQVYVAIQEEDELFELSIDNEATSKAHLRTLAEDSEFFFDLIDVLNRLSD